MELETINKLYLELSQIATAKTEREQELEAENSRLKRFGYHNLEKYKHKKSKGIYGKIGHASLQTDVPLMDMSDVVVYKGEDE